VSIWDVSSIYSGNRAVTLDHVLYGHEKFVAAAALNGAEQPRLLATVSGNNRVRLWDLSADPHEQPIVFPAEVEVQDLAFSSESHTLIVVSKDNAVQRWSLDYQELIPMACRITGRNLTWDEWQRAFGSAAYKRTCADFPPHPSYITHLLNDASTQAQQGQISAAKAAYNQAQQLSPDYVIGAGYWNKLCRNGVVWGHVKDVLDACGRAVAQAPDTGDYRDSRGLMRVLIGDTAGAIEDFQAYIDWANRTNTQANKAAIAERERWIAALRAGRKPIDAATLEALREAE
jgi:tetratricopeptide (TPR) repeat protein